MKYTKIFKPFSAFLLLTLSVFLIGCQDDVSDDNLTNDSFVGFSFDETVALPEGESQTMAVSVYATAKSSSDRTVSLYIDETATTAAAANYSVASSVTIPAGSMMGSFDVTINNSPALGFGGKTIVVGMTVTSDLDQPTAFTGTTGNGDLMVTEDMLIINAKTLCEDEQMMIQITLDGWPEELYWWITNVAGDVVADPGPYAQYANPYAGMSGDILQELCLPAGDYIFNIYDDWGDGGGPITVSSGGVVIYSSGGGYGGFDSVAFTL